MPQILSPTVYMLFQKTISCEIRFTLDCWKMHLKLLIH